MPCYQSNNVPSGYGKIGTGGYATEAECLQACKEGACCNGTTCSVKPQCQCDAAAGEVFKGVGTTCEPASCFFCENWGSLTPEVFNVRLDGLWHFGYQNASDLDGPHLLNRLFVTTGGGLVTAVYATTNSVFDTPRVQLSAYCRNSGLGIEFYPFVGLGQGAGIDWGPRGVFPIDEICDGRAYSVDNQFFRGTFSIESCSNPLP